MAIYLVAIFRILQKKNDSYQAYTGRKMAKNKVST